jgi:hypothetical protein
MNTMNEQELLRIVTTLLAPSAEVTADELEDLTDKFAGAIPHPGGTDLLHYPQNWGLPADPSPEEIVKEVLSWKPRVLSMTVTSIHRHLSRSDLFCVGVEVEGKIRTQVVSSLKPNVGDTCAVALSGTRLNRGKKVTHGFVDGAYTAGELLGLTSELPGVELPLVLF